MPEMWHLLFQWFVDIRSSVESRLKRRIVIAAARGLIHDIKASAVSAGLPPPGPPSIEHPSLMNVAGKPFHQHQAPDAAFQYQPWHVQTPHAQRHCQFARCSSSVRPFVWWGQRVRRPSQMSLWGGAPPRDRVSPIAWTAAGGHCSLARSEGRLFQQLREQEHVDVAPQLWRGRRGRQDQPRPVTVALFDVHQHGAARPLAHAAAWAAFQGQTERIIRNFVVPDVVPMIRSFSPSCSYNEQDVLRDLEQLLPDWSEEREQSMDYCILHLDAYSVHKTQAVKELVRRKGFV